jgi:hypothetical protein
MACCLECFDAKHITGKKVSPAGIPTWQFWILDFGFWIERTSMAPTIQNPKSKIQN